MSQSASRMDDSNLKMAARSVVERPSQPQVPSSSPTRLLPFDTLATELIEQIFRFACPYIDCPGLQPLKLPLKKHRPLNLQVTDPAKLSMVCKKWRTIAEGYPSLWTNLVINVSRISLNAWNQSICAILRRRLLKSGTRPLKIRVNDYNRGWHTYSMISRVLNLLILHSQRWHTIIFDFPIQGNDFVLMLNSLEGRLPLLQSLQILTSDSDFDNGINNSTKSLVFLAAPALNHLCLGSFSFRHIVQIPWTQISEVTFENNIDVFFRDFWEIMVCLAASIKVLRLSSHSLSSIRPPSTNEKPINLPKLRKLYSGNCEGILNHLTCPSLESLELGDGDEAEIRRFLENSSCALRHIHLGYIQRKNGHGWHQEGTQYSAILQSPSLSTLKSLSLSGISNSILDLLAFDYLLLSLDTLYVDIRIPNGYRDIRNFLSSRVAGLRKVVQSRTQAISDVKKHLLRSCFFTFHLEVGCSKGPRDPWDTTPLEDLRLFCISRHVLVQLDIFTARVN